jgi:hypothetical protein
MSSIGMFLSAKSSSSNLKLTLDKTADGELSMCIFGEHEGQKIQIDFDTLTRAEALELADYIQFKAGNN